MSDFEPLDFKKEGITLDYKTAGVDIDANLKRYCVDSIDLLSLMFISMGVSGCIYWEDCYG